MTSHNVKKALQEHANAERALLMQGYFKTGKGQYGEGDIFIGISMPEARKIAKHFIKLAYSEVQKLLDSKIHEERMVGLLILTYQFEKADEKQKQKIYELYLKNVYRGRVNNWDLVDVTYRGVVGAYLYNKPRDVLFELATSDDIWQKRVAIISTFYFLAKGDPSTTLEISEILVRDKHDLIQKAVGWALREMGKVVDEKLLTDFLEKHSQQMPRTMLRYSIERLTPAQKLYYMKPKTI